MKREEIAEIAINEIFKIFNQLDNDQRMFALDHINGTICNECGDYYTDCGYEDF